MILRDSGTYLGLLSFFSFSFSVIAAVLAIDMYTLLRTGQMGRTWRVLIIASVMFALAQVVRMAELLNWRVTDYGLSQIIELVFVLALAYAFFLQRQSFTQAAELRGETRRTLRHTPAIPISDAAKSSTLDTVESTMKTREAPQNTSKSQPVLFAAAEEGHTLPLLEVVDDPEIEWRPSVPQKSRFEPSTPLLTRRGE